LASATFWIDEIKSVQGLTRLVAGRGPQLVALVLLLALGVDAALILTRALSHGPDLPPPGVATGPVLPRVSVNPTLQLATIVNAHLFGAAGVVSGGSDAPATSMPLILAGVIADPDPAKGVAIIGENAAAGKLYAVGAAIPGGVHLHAVYADRVLLERNGGLETLMLPRTPISGGGRPQSPAIGVSPRTAGAGREPASLLAGLVRIQPVFNQGKLQGYRIFPGGTHGTSAFTQLGLRGGDLIEAVNGTALDDAGRAMEVLQTLGSSATATVTVSRNGQSQEVNLNLANLNLDDAGDNGAAGQAGTGPTAVGAPGTDQPPVSPPQNRGRPLPAANGNPPSGDRSTGGLMAPQPGGTDTPPSQPAP